MTNFLAHAASNMCTKEKPVRHKSAPLPDKSLLCGRGSTRRRSSLIRRMSEKSMVKKISEAIKAELEELDSAYDSDLESTFHNSNSSFGFYESGASDSEKEKDSCLGPGLSDVQRISSEEGYSEAQFLWERAEGGQPVKVVPPFHRKELKMGDILGLGGFSQVSAVEEIELKVEYSTRRSSSEEAARERVVKKAEQDSSLVVKHLNRKLLRKPKEFKAAAMDLEREAKILSLAQHPNIIRLRGLALGGTAALDSGHYNGFFLLLDQLDDTLDKRLQRWREKTATAPGVPVVCTHAQQLASALAYLHDHRVLFRDVKPQNIGFISNRNDSSNSADRLQLFDFGLARALPPPLGHQEVYHMSLAGTTRYMAPEVMQGLHYNCQADTYSWALVVWEMLDKTNKPYFEVPSRVYFQEYVCAMGVRPSMDGEHWKSIPAALKRLLSQAWCSSLEERLTMATAHNELERILESLPAQEFVH